MLCKALYFFVLELAKYVAEFSSGFKQVILYCAWGRKIRNQTSSILHSPLTETHLILSFMVDPH